MDNLRKYSNQNKLQEAVKFYIASHLTTKYERTKLA